MNYQRVATRTNLKRSFCITVSRRTGYSADATTYSSDAAHTAALAWMKKRYRDGKHYLTGIFTEGILAFGWSHGNKFVGEFITTTEPGLTFSGEVSTCYRAETTDEEVETMLDELGSAIGAALHQTRVYIAYRDSTWILQADGLTSPRTE